MSTGIVLILIIVIILVGWMLYLVQIKHYSKKESGLIIVDEIERACHFAKRNYNVYQLRQINFSIQQIIQQNMLAYEESVKKLHVCKYFKFSYYECVNQDILVLHMDILGISSEYQSQLSNLGTLLEKLLQDVCISRFGVLNYPLVYLSHVNEGAVSYVIARNAYGNSLVQQRRYSDDRNNIPNMEELEED
ncbi:MAG: hypothetical protein RR705_03005 [Lachnospiraceae bacterium]